MIAHLHASDSRLSGSPWCWAGTFPLCHPARGSCEPSLRSGDGQVLQKGLAQCQTFHSHEIFTILVSCTMAGGYISTRNSFILTLSQLWLSCLVGSFPIKRGWWLCFHTCQLLLVKRCAVAFCLQISPFLLGSHALHGPGLYFLAGRLDCPLLTCKEMDSA